MIDLTSELKKINIQNYIPIDSKKPCNTKGTYMIKTCPFCHSKSGNHFWIWKNRYGSYSGCCKGGNLWDWYEEYEGLSRGEARKKCIEVLNLSSKGESFVTKEDLSYKKQLENVLKNTENKMVLAILDGNTENYIQELRNKIKINKMIVGPEEIAIGKIIKKTIEKLEKLVKLYISLDIHDSIFIELLLNLEGKRSIFSKFDYCSHINKEYLI